MSIVNSMHFSRLGQGVENSNEIVYKSQENNDELSLGLLILMKSMENVLSCPSRAIKKSATSIIDLLSAHRSASSIISYQNLLDKLFDMSIFLLKKSSSASIEFIEAVEEIAKCSDAALVNMRDERTLDTLLLYLCRLNYTDAVHIFLKNSLVDVNICDEYLNSPLLVTMAVHQNQDIAKALIIGGANPRLRNENNLCALEFLVSQPALNIVDNELMVSFFCYL